MEYLSIKQTADKWGISKRRIQVLCTKNRIPGAIRIGYAWAIPSNAVKPSDVCFKNWKIKKHIIRGVNLN